MPFEIQRSGFALVPPDVLVVRPASLYFVFASRAAIMLENCSANTDLRSQGHGFGGHPEAVKTLAGGVFPGFSRVGNTVNPPREGSCVVISTGPASTFAGRLACKASDLRRQISS